MRSYLSGLLAMLIAIGPNILDGQKGNLTGAYVFKYVGPTSCSYSEVVNRNNWKVKLNSPYVRCVASIEEEPCTFTTDCISYYISIIDIDLYQPSTDIIIVAKQSASTPGKYVVDYTERASDHAIVSLSVENFEQ